jgi:hypothetical protein
MFALTYTAVCVVRRYKLRTKTQAAKVFHLLPPALYLLPSAVIIGNKLFHHYDSEKINQTINYDF